MSHPDAFDVNVAGYRVLFTGKYYTAFDAAGKVIGYNLLFCKLAHAAKASLDIQCDGREDGLNIIHMIEALNGVFRDEELGVKPDFDDAEENRIDWRKLFIFGGRSRRRIMTRDTTDDVHELMEKKSKKKKRGCL